MRPNLHFARSPIRLNVVTPESRGQAPILEMRRISKRFDATQALNDVSLTLYPGEVHALLGENGAGKSTLIKIMTGIHQPDAGQILLDGRPVQIHNAMHAQSLGIVAIYQEPMVFPDLTVAENIFIGHAERNPFMRWGQTYRKAREILALLDVKLDVRMPARGLTLAAQQAVEIAKAISLNARVLIMDEPTASLSAHEVEQLFKLVNTLRERGVAILFISHRLDEVFSIADRVTILRDGQWISTRPRNEVTSELAIREMVGREITDFSPKRRPSGAASCCSRCATWAKPAPLRGSASTYTAAKCWDSPGWSARAAPTLGWPCSASSRPTRVRSSSRGARA